MALLPVALFTCDTSTGTWPGFLALLPVASACLLIAAGPQNPVNRLILANRASVFLGKVSYTLYLWHWPLLSFAFLILGGEAYAGAHTLRAGLLAVAFVLAALTWRFIEVPIRQGNFLGRYKVPVLTGAMCLMAAAGLVVWLSGGLVLFMGERARAIHAQMARPPEVEPEALEKLGLKNGELGLVRFRDAGAKETIAIVGDSHAQSAYPGIAGLGEEMGFNTLMLGYFPVRQLFDNAAHPARILDILARRPDIRDVFLIVRGSLYTAKAPNPGQRGADPLPGKSPEEFCAEMAAFAKKLVALGKNVILVEDVPDLDTDMRELLAPALARHPFREQYRKTARADALARQQTFLAILDKLAGIPGVTVLRGALDAFCPGETCTLFTDDGLPLYYDDDHLSRVGSDKLAREIIAPWLERQNRAREARGEGRGD